MNAELMERVNREDREWREARLHEAAHGNWLGKDECAVCLAIYPESPYLRLTPMARERLGIEDYRAIADRAESLSVVVGAIWSSRHGWVCTAERDGVRTRLRASGPLAAVLAGLLDDCEQYAGDAWTPEELVQIAAQSGIEVRRG